jgi:hypothetical protein
LLILWFGAAPAHEYGSYNRSIKNLLYFLTNHRPVARIRALAQWKSAGGEPALETVIIDWLDVLIAMAAIAWGIFGFWAAGHALLYKRIRAPR